MSYTMDIPGVLPPSLSDIVFRVFCLARTPSLALATRDDISKANNCIDISKRATNFIKNQNKNYFL